MMVPYHPEKWHVRDTHLVGFAVDTERNPVQIESEEVKKPEKALTLNTRRPDILQHLAYPTSTPKILSFSLSNTVSIPFPCKIISSSFA